MFWLLLVGDHTLNNDAFDIISCLNPMLYFLSLVIYGFLALFLTVLPIPASASPLLNIKMPFSSLHGRFVFLFPNWIRHFSLCLFFSIFASTFLFFAVFIQYLKCLIDQSRNSISGGRFSSIKRRTNDDEVNVAYYWNVAFIVCFLSIPNYLNAI